MNLLSNSNYWVDKIFSKTSILTWIFDHVTWKSIGNIYSQWTTTVSKLAASKQRGQKIWETAQFGLEIWPHELKIDREHKLSRGIHCTKLGNFQWKESKDIEPTSLGPQTNRQPNWQVQNNMPPFFKGGQNKIPLKH